MATSEETGKPEERVISGWQRKLLTFMTADQGLSDSDLLRVGVTSAVLVPALRVTDWVLEGLIIGLFAMLKYKGFTEGSIWAVLWGFNLMLSGMVLKLNDRTRIDITLMQTLRKVVNAVIRKTKTLGYSLELLIASRLLLWDGPDCLLIFLKERLKSGEVMFLLLVAASGFQMFVWTKIYWYGYEGISDLLKLLGVFRT